MSQFEMPKLNVFLKKKMYSSIDCFAQVKPGAFFVITGQEMGLAWVFSLRAVHRITQLPQEAGVTCNTAA